MAPARPLKPRQESPWLPHGGGGKRRQTKRRARFVRSPQRRTSWIGLLCRCARHTSAHLARRTESRMWIHSRKGKRNSVGWQSPHAANHSPPHLGDTERQC